MRYVDQIVDTILKHYPESQAIYLFGSYGTNSEWPDSDVDIAVLLPPARARGARLALSDCHLELERALNKSVDLINLRQTDAVIRFEIVMKGRRIYVADLYAADEFDMVAMSLYQKLNEERAEILAEGLRSGSFYAL